MIAVSILVVHPEHEAATRIAEALRSVGHDVVVVPDGERAIDRFIQRPSDVLIVEMLLPGRDGATTIESIRWAPEGGKAALVLLGSRGTDRAVLESAGERLRAHAAIPGPLDLGRITGAVAELTGAGNTTRNAISISDAVTPSEAWTDATTRPGTRQVTPPIVTAAPPVAGSNLPSPSPSEREFTELDEELTGNWGPGDLPGAEREGADVERHALVGAREANHEAGPETDQFVSGDLNTTPFPRLLHLLATSRKHGALVLTSIDDRRRTTTGESPKKVVFFRSGVPRYVQSNLIQECLGQVLARGGFISHTTLEESVDRMRLGEGRQGAVLLSIGAINPHQLRDALEDQLRVKLFDLFAWTAGTYGFQEDVPTPPETVTLEMSLPEIVLKGVVHRIPPQRLLERLSPHLESYVVPELRQLSRFGRVELAPEAAQVLHSLDGTARLRDLLARAGDRPGTAAQLVYALHCTDAVYFSPDAHYTTRVSNDDVSEASSVTMALATLREELGRLCRLLRAEKYQEALGAPPGDRAAAVARADHLRARFQPVTEPGAAPRDLRALAFEVSARLVHAREALGAAPGERRTPLELAQAAFDGDVPTRDEKSKSNPQRNAKRHAHSEPPLADEVYSAAPPGHEAVDPSAPLDPGRATVPEPLSGPETGRLTLPDERSVPVATPGEQFTPSVGSPPVSNVSADFAGPMSTVASTELGPDAAIPAPRLGTPPAPQFGNPRERRFESSEVSLFTGDSIDVTTAPDETGTIESAVTDRNSETPTDPLAGNGQEEQDEHQYEHRDEHDDDDFDTGVLAPVEVTAEDAPVDEFEFAGEGDGDSQVSVAFTDAGPTLDEQVDRLYRAERHFRRGERSLGRGKVEDAVQAFSRAAELCPEEGEFVSHVGYARYQAARGEEELSRALEELDQGALLSPKLDITHLLRARVLADRNERVAAREAYARALAANPDCTEALDGLHALD